MNVLTNRPILKVLLFLLGYVFMGLLLMNWVDVSPEHYSKKSLAIVEYWKSHSISKSNFIPKTIDEDKFYLSHPPLAYYSLYIYQIFFKSNGYYYLNIVLICLSAFFVYLSICQLLLKRASRDECFYGWAGMLIYLTSYPILKYQLFNYHPDIFVLPFLIICQYLFLKLLMKERYRSLKYLVLIGLSLFIMSYSSWFGVVFGLIVLLIAIFNLRRGYKLVPYILMAIAITAGATLLTYFQYASLGGWKNVIFYFKDAYLRESPLYGHFKQTGFQIIYQLVKNLGILFVTLLTLVAFALIGKKKRLLFTKNGYRYLIIGFAPVVLYSILLIQYFQNTFVSLYFVAPLVVTICIWLEKLLKGNESQMKLLKILLFIVITNLSLFLIF